MKNKMFGPFPVFELQNSEIKCSQRTKITEVEPQVVFIKKPEGRSSLLEKTVSAHLKLCFE